MAHTFIEMLQQLTALVVGGLIGLGFGKVQDFARRKNEKRQAEGRLENGWTVMPGSGGRVALLLIALVLIQIICPILFSGNTKWWVSGGLVAGYAWILFKQLLEKKARNS